ncbi:cation efflux protein, CzcI-like [Acinetobacter sp. YH12049]|uniref:cation efflux protein, CzcI-like n=1 Tax=Acinetobacter sp. YH12049 TaxID=2601054 RepID=UPI001C5521EA|nr:cation efflux protein, CzcI-like [Acinetobacter sp. YH12049]
MRSATWITVLVGLFMFQSLWNVAAAFCVHEEQTQVVQSYHFGHHQNTLCVSNETNPQHSLHQASDESSSKPVKNIANDLQLGEDHQDHLPSMTHLIVQNQQSILFIAHQAFEYSPKFVWKNLYQAPDLLLQTPPPVYAPLMAG